MLITPSNSQPIQLIIKPIINHNETKVVCVKVNDIRPKYQDLQEWMLDPNNVYIGRRGIVFISRVRYPPKDSIWCNPFKIQGSLTREQVIDQYRYYIINKIRNQEITLDQLQTLRGKNLGCWCKERGQNISCHGDVLVELLNNGVTF